jgi:hypothetical protein
LSRRLLLAAVWKTLRVQACTLCAFVAAAPAGAVPPGGQRVHLVDTAKDAGLTSPTICGKQGNPSILDGTGPGLTLLDYDGDGLLDIYLVNGGTEYDAGPVHLANVLYRNLGDGRFQDVTQAAGVGDRYFGQGAVAGDVNGDGHTDLYVMSYGRNTLYRNQGDGTFIDDTERAGVGYTGWSAGAGFADVDRDGDLDLYVGNYVGFDPETTPRLGNPRCVFMGVKVFCGPRGLTPLQDTFYRNRGDGTFEDRTRQAGLWQDEPYYSLGVVLGDVDDDGDVDIYVANDATPNLLFLNDGKGMFREEGLLQGVAFSQDGAEQAGMGTDMADYDGDGRTDLIVTNFSHDTNTLYRNQGEMFDVVTFAAGLGEASLDRLGWGVAFVDLDRDGWLDLFVSNGHTYPQMDGRGLGTSYRQYNQVFLNQGNGTFRDISEEAGPGMKVQLSSRGAAFGDMDNDGDTDIVLVNLGDPPTLLRNDSAARAWIGFHLRGQQGNRDAIGARVTVTAGGRRRMGDVRAGGGFLSGSDVRLLFGLGSVERVESVEVRWPDGTTTRHPGLATGTYHRLAQPPAP